jgi:hypothetical protein
MSFKTVWLIESISDKMCNETYIKLLMHCLHHSAIEHLPTVVNAKKLINFSQHKVQLASVATPASRLCGRHCSGNATLTVCTGFVICGSADEGILFPRRWVRPAAGEPFAAVAVVINLIQMDE